MINDSPTKLYVEYINTEYSKKINAGELLAKAARNILLELKLSSQNHYLIKNIATDLHQQAVDMAYSKAYDCSPKIEEYFKLAFQLMYKYWDEKANKELIQFLSDVLYYDKNNEELLNLYTKSILLEEEYLSIIKKKYDSFI